jgi:ABC-type nickel/cobalt efflux system permease component RcnA
MKRSSPLREFFQLVAPALLGLLAAGFLLAHPMGNFSISHYARFEPSSSGIQLTYALDLAEVPTFELLRDWKMERTSPAADLQRRALEQAREWVANLQISINGQPVAAAVRSADLVIADGAGGLPVLRVTARAELPPTAGLVEYEDRNFPDRAGWKEIVIATGRAAVSRPSHPATDLSKALSAYPEDPSLAPPQDLRARFDWTPLAAPAPNAPPATVSPATAPAASPVAVEPVPQPAPPVQSQPQQSPAAPVTAPGVVQKGDTLSELLRKGDLSFGMMLTALAVAFAFGAMHALSPGHGKTIVAAYLVGSRGTFKHAMLLGGMVTLTHTASVFLLGLGTLFLSRYVVPDKIIPVLSVVSGLMIVVVGASMFHRRLQALAGGHDHTHSHSHSSGFGGHSHELEPAHALAAGSAATVPHPTYVHSHGGGPSHTHGPGEDPGHRHDHEDHHPDHHHHGPGGHTHYVEGEVTMGSLMGLAVSGGLVPCPSALVLLLSAIAIGRVTLGLALLTSFSLGLSLVLIAIGGVVLYAKNLLPDRPAVHNHTLVKTMPVISAGVITVVGLLMTAVALGWVRPY